MGGCISSLAFPRPLIDMEFYEESLTRRQDLLYLTTSKGERIPAVHVKTKRFPGPAGLKKKTVLYSHGNAEDLGLHLEYIDAFAKAVDCDVFSYEYVGYSLSRFEGGDPSEAGCIRSIDAAWRYLVDELKIPPNLIVIFGRSIGSGPAVDLASREVEGASASPLDAAGVLLQSPIESGARVAFGNTVSSIGYYLDIFKNYEKIEKVKAPVGIMHGTWDTVVDVSNGQNLFRLVQQPFQPLWIDGYGHNDMPNDQCFFYAKAFLDSCK